jgi:hypothetical protein
MSTLIPSKEYYKAKKLILAKNYFTIRPFPDMEDAIVPHVTFRISIHRRRKTNQSLTGISLPKHANYLWPYKMSNFGI